MKSIWNPVQIFCTPESGTRCILAMSIYDHRPIDAACGSRADGWGVRACAAALTVGLIFCTLFHQGKSVRKNVCLIFW